MCLLMMIAMRELMSAVPLHFNVDVIVPVFREWMHALPRAFEVFGCIAVFAGAK